MKYRKCVSSLTIMMHRRRLITPSSSSSAAAGSTGRVRDASTRAGSGFFSWYTKQLDEFPMTTKVVSSALIAALGDIICQIFENNFAVDNDDDQNDVDITAYNRQEVIEPLLDVLPSKMGSEGKIALQKQIKNSATATKPMVASLDPDIDWCRTGRFLLIGAFWVAPVTHLWYGFLSTRLIPGVATPTLVVKRLFLDQFGAAPIFCPTFMGLLWLLEGKPLSEVKTDLIEAGPTLVTSNWKLWIPAMGIMFSVVPLKFQVVYSNFVGLVWTVYLSYASTRLSSQTSIKDESSAAA